jgi:hypothetical protein
MIGDQDNPALHVVWLLWNKKQLQCPRLDRMEQNFPQLLATGSCRGQYCSFVAYLSWDSAPTACTAGLGKQPFRPSHFQKP